jgi:FtsP/CotA-like multicopper oxidase with cupredoxin domain
MESRKRVMWLGLFFVLILLTLAGCAGATNAPTGLPTATPAPARMTSGESAGHGMMDAVPDQNVPNATAPRGGQPLTPRIENGIKIFELTATPVKWQILKDVTATAWTYNGTVPGPMIRVTEGDQVRIVLKNNLTADTSIHWHGIPVPNAMDGVPPFTQKPVKPGETFTYEFTASPAGTFMYHSHVETDTQIPIGLYAPFVIDPKDNAKRPDVDVTLMLSEWRIVSGKTYAAMPMGGMEPNYFTINGKAFPESETIDTKVGQRVRIRFANVGQFAHPMHLHGTFFKIVATDGNPVPEAAQWTKDTINIAPGERYDIEFTATNPGTWMLHCHIPHHLTNDNVEPGGLMLMVNVNP